MDSTVEVPFACVNLEKCQQVQIVTEVERIIGNISYEDFFQNFLLVNKPCIISQEMTASWRSRNEWVDNNGRPNFEYLKEKFGKSQAPVADCNDQYFNAQKKVDMTVESFLDYWEKYIADGHPNGEPCLYLKDWHFTKEFPDYSAYEWPKLFSSDWLNEHWAVNGEDDYKFVYMGPKGSWTPLHVDVFTSYSWSTNVCGQKKWMLLPPGRESKLKTSAGNLPFQKELSLEQTKEGIFVDQFAGETIFIPTGWHHQVWNMADTISINHNWLNGCCIENTWKELIKGLEAVENELSDCKDMDGWNEQCQLVLKAVAGIDLAEFAKFILFIAQKRLSRLQGEEIETTDHWFLGENHACFDLVKISKILHNLRHVSQLDFDADICKIDNVLKNKYNLIM